MSEAQLATRPRRGDIHPITGLVYWDTWMGKERWRDAETIERWHKNVMRAVVKWQRIDPERHRATAKRFRAKHGKRRNAEARGYRNQWKKLRLKTNPVYALCVLIATRIRVVLKRNGLSKDFKSMSTIGCSGEFLRAHLERQFKPGMTWANRGYYGWHVDHRIPLATAKTVADVKRLFHYTNLQPLWWRDNLAKKNKIQST